MKLATHEETKDMDHTVTKEAAALEATNAIAGDDLKVKTFVRGL